MSFPTCAVCGAELGPWEGHACLSHVELSHRTDRFSWRNHLSISDLALIALENESGPLSAYDMQRAIARDLGRSVRVQSVAAVIGADQRFCWSGKGIYGLFRHDRLPAVRTLAGVAGVVLAAYDAPVAISDLTFVLKRAGYRFQDFSLEAAVHRDAEQLGFRFSWVPDAWEQHVRIVGACDVRRALVRNWSGWQAPRWPVDEMLERWRGRVQEGTDERARRLASVGECVALSQR